MTNNLEEIQYLNLLQEIKTNGVTKEDRTGIGTRYKFGCSMRFSLRENTLPLLTTKRVFWRGVVEELLFFLSGKTDTTILESRGVNIWKGNTTRDFLDKLGLTSLRAGDLGCSYPHQWRNFGGEHPQIPETEGLVGFDQIAYLVNTLKSNPLDRRLILNGWCANQLKYMALPPCHVMYIFNVNPLTKELNCHLTIRSNDFFLGAPFNIASASLLTYLLAKTANLSPGELFYTVTDCHIYLNHLEAVDTQLAREPYPFPKLEIKKQLSSLEDLMAVTFDDLILKDYKCHPAIKAPMAI